jgi:hypothetical protein
MAEQSHRTLRREDADMKVRRGLVATVLALVFTGCLEPPVSESLDIRILPGGASVVSIGVALRKPSDYAENPKVRQRLDAETRALEEGTDPWSIRLRDGEPSRQRDVTDRENGRLYRVTRQARFEEFSDLRVFLRDTGVGVIYAEGPDWAELSMLPGRTGRPTTAQRERVKTELEAWSNSLAAYFAATADLYAYLERAPERARPCLARILTKLPEDETLSDEETALTSAVDDAMGEIGSVLVAPPDEAYTIDELSRLVYDPFPAPIRVAVPGTIVEREGYPGELGAPLAIPVMSLWSAFARLEGRWVAPDLALASWRQEVATDGSKIDFEAFVALPRHASKPSADEVRGAIEDQLRVAPVYRARWTPSDENVDPLPF